MDNRVSAFVSVIIPVFNDSEQLKRCLEALETQTYPKNLYEIIVVDNASNEDIESVVKQFCQALTTHENRPGSYAARNKGISLAQGNVIAFTDSDCIPGSDWIEKGVANLLYTPNCGLVAGKVELFYKNPNQPTSVELYESITAFPQEAYVEKCRFGATANLFTFKSVIDRVGSFKDAIKSGGDFEWGQRVFSSGYKQVYADDVCVAHPARYSLAQMHKKVIRVAGGYHDRYKEDGSHFKILVKDIGKDLKPPLGTIFKLYSDERLNKKQRFGCILVMLFVRYTRAWERIRLQLGGSTKR